MTKLGRPGNSREEFADLNDFSPSCRPMGKHRVTPAQQFIDKAFALATDMKQAGLIPPHVTAEEFLAGSWPHVQRSASRFGVDRRDWPAAKRQATSQAGAEGGPFPFAGTLAMGVPHGESKMGDSHESETLLPAYDPDWRARFARAHEALKDCKSGDASEAQRRIHLDEMHEAHHAQFRTVEELRDFEMKSVRPLAAGLDVAQPHFPPGATVEQVRAIIDTYEADIERAYRLRDRLPPFDPPGLVAFTTPARPGVQRHVEVLELERSHEGPAETCLMVMEANAEEAHVCFVWQDETRSVCNNIERLADRVYRDRLAPSSWWGRFGSFRRWLGLGGYAPSQVTFYEYVPVRIERVRSDQIHRVELTWSGKRFVKPDWGSSLAGVPPYLESVSTPEVPPVGGQVSQGMLAGGA